MGSGGGGGGVVCAFGQRMWRPAPAHHCCMALHALGPPVCFSAPWQFQDRHGKATTRFADGSTYVGEYVKDQHWGFGELTLVTGEYYRGGWVAGKKSGVGMFVYKSGAVYK